MPKFNKKQSELETHFDKWLYVFTHLQKLQDRPKELQSRVFKKLFEVAEIAGFTEEERKEYEESLKNYRDIKNVVDTAREEGKIEEKEDVIERCMEEDMQPEIISKIVGMPIDKVKLIIKKIKKRKEGEK